MSKRGDKEFLNDIVQSIERIEKYTDNMNYDTFLQDIKTQDAVLRNLEIIGEAAKCLSKELKLIHRNIKWKEISGMRDKVIHSYFGVKWDIVWSVIKYNLLELKNKITTIITEIPI